MWVSGSRPDQRHVHPGVSNGHATGRMHATESSRRRCSHRLERRASVPAGTAALSTAHPRSGSRLDDSLSELQPEKETRHDALAESAFQNLERTVAEPCCPSRRPNVSAGRRSDWLHAARPQRGSRGQGSGAARMTQTSTREPLLLSSSAAARRPARGGALYVRRSPRTMALGPLGRTGRPLRNARYP